MPSDVSDKTRRAFLATMIERLLVYGPLGRLASAVAAAPDDAVLHGALAFEDIINNPAQAVNVWDFEAAIRTRMNPGHYAYLAQGSDDLGTIAANRRGFAKIGLRARRLNGVGKVDLAVDLLGQRVNSPIFLSPIGAQQMFHPEGELAVARAAKATNSLQVLSTFTNSSVEDVAAARGGSGWFQLYAATDWPITERLLKRAEHAGCTAVVWTVDVAARNLEAIKRFDRPNNTACRGCHADKADDFSLRRMFDGLDMAKAHFEMDGLTWNFISRLKGATKMKLLVKGIQTGEDAARCVQHGADGIIVSNHGGRADETLRGAIDCLPEVVAAAGGRIPILIDSGFRRGTDIFKALALGATAVGIGRPYIWGLGSFGQAGVERVIDILTSELRIVMQQMGARTIEDISRSSLGSV